MDPLTLLRELFGEEPIRKVVTSGFDSVHKIAAATPESLSFFSGINEAVARQIVASAEESLSGPPSAAYRGSLTGSAEAPSAREPALPVKPRVPPPSKESGGKREKGQSDLLDENPLYDAGGILKTVAREPRPKDYMDDDFLDQVGLSDAEANFLDGISPWPGGTASREKSSFASLNAGISSVGQPPEREEKEVEYAPITDWLPEKDPDPVPRLVRAPELDPGPPDAAVAADSPVTAVFGQPEPARPTPSLENSPAEVPPPADAATARELSEKPSLWKFGK
jgi:hypothetical protein